MILFSPSKGASIHALHSALADCHSHSRRVDIFMQTESTIGGVQFGLCPNVRLELNLVPLSITMCTGLYFYYYIVVGRRLHPCCELSLSPRGPQLRPGEHHPEGLQHMVRFTDDDA